jgi:hypothetical protein
MNPVMLSITRQQVIGALKATGSTDPDVLAAAKEEMLSSVKRPKLVALVGVVSGGAMTLTVLGAVIGIPLIIAGVWVWHRAGRNSRTVEAGFAEYARVVSSRAPIMRM